MKEKGKKNNKKKKQRGGTNYSESVTTKLFCCMLKFCPINVYQLNVKIFFTKFFTKFRKFIFNMVRKVADISKLK